MYTQYQCFGSGAFLNDGALLAPIRSDFSLLFRNHFRHCIPTAGHGTFSSGISFFVFAQIGFSGEAKEIFQ